MCPGLGEWWLHKVKISETYTLLVIVKYSMLKLRHDYITISFLRQFVLCLEWQAFR